MTYYSEEFKAKMVQKMSLPGGRTASSLARETGVSQTALSRWLREAGRVQGMDQPRRPQDWSVQEKWELVLEAEGLSGEQLGALLRRRGVHQVQLEQWREAMRSALDAPWSKPSKSSPQTRRIRELEKELGRKEKALAETAALLVLKKKVRAIWGDEDDDT